MFYQHGGAKAKFGDIAKEAGISRPTLYAAFEDKNAIMIATIHHVSEQLLEAIKEQIADKVTAEDRLTLFTMFLSLSLINLFSSLKTPLIS